MNMIKKYPVRDYLSVETSIFHHTRHAVGMTPLSDASLQDAGVGRRCFSTERYIPTECSLMTANAHTDRRDAINRVSTIHKTTNNLKTRSSVGGKQR